MTQYDTTARVTTYTALATVTFAKTVAGTERAVTATMIFPGTSPGSFAWADLTTHSNGYGLTLEIGDTTYRSTSGSTTVTAYGEVDGVVKGTFSGTLSSESGATVTISGGAFPAVRSPDKVKISSTTTESKVRGNGDGHANTTYLLSDDGSVAWWDAAGFVDILLPFSDDGAVTIDCPRASAGVEVWNLKPNSKITMRIGNQYYVGATGTTQIKQFAPSILNFFTGTFAGEMKNTETGASSPSAAVSGPSGLTRSQCIVVRCGRSDTARRAVGAAA